MLSDKEIDDIVYAARQSGADDTYSVVRAACSKALEKQAAQSYPNAPWLTEAHALCTDHFIPQGHITERIRALREKLAAQPVPQCTRSHPHEQMDGYCELHTEIARLTNENARLKAAQPVEPVAWCALSIGGKSISYFDGKPVIMTGPVGNDCHPTPLYTTPPDTAAELERLREENERLKTTPPEKRQDLHCVVSDIASECRELRAENTKLRAAVGWAAGVLETTRVWCSLEIHKAFRKPIIDQAIATLKEAIPNE